MFTLRLEEVGRHISLFEGAYGDCITLAHAIERFPVDYISLEVYDNETGKVYYHKLSPHWA